MKSSKFPYKFQSLCLATFKMKSEREKLAEKDYERSNMESFKKKKFREIGEELKL